MYDMAGCQVAVPSHTIHYVVKYAMTMTLI